MSQETLLPWEAPVATRLCRPMTSLNADISYRNNFTDQRKCFYFTGIRDTLICYYYYYCKGFLDVSLTLL